MWPFFSSVFNRQPCPAGDSCEVPNCFFLHSNTTIPTRSPGLAHRELTTNSQSPPAKRLRLAHDDVPVADSPVFTGLRAQKPVLTPPKHQENTDTSTPNQSQDNGKVDNALPETAVRPVSPPPKKTSPDVKTEPEVEEEVKLLPRKIQHDPMSFPQRLTRLKALHDAMTPFNNKVALAVKPSTKALHLSANRLRKLAVDEEANIALENRIMYDNVIKHRLVAYKRMTQEEWVAFRREAVAKENPGHPKKPPPKKVETGLTLKEEVALLSKMLASQNSLEAHGFVTKKPTDTEIEESRATQISCDFWEVCDRCGTRFQVFPDRREKDGALTTGGKCRHHWGKKTWPRRSKGQDEPAKYTCCNETVGSEGCTVSDTHVYKFTDVDRMSSIMPFVETPENPKVEPQTAVCFDCEMGYTTQGFELLRLTVVSWPSHRPLIDVLVRPIGFILDLNTQWSGVTMDQFLNAKPYDPDNPKPNRKDLRIVESPHAARDLFLTHVSPTTPVLGHSLENDLNVIRLIHPTIVDSVILFPTRSGLPYRHGLKTLAKQHLGIDVQQGGASGHDSYEDARTTGELIRFEVARRWKRLKEAGWVIRDGGVFPPLPTGQPPSSVPAAPMIPENDNTSTKRKLDMIEDD